MNNIYILTSSDYSNLWKVKIKQFTFKEVIEEIENNRSKEIFVTQADDKIWMESFNNNTGAVVCHDLKNKISLYAREWYVKL
jgi:hypothetical protein